MQICTSAVLRRVHASSTFLRAVRVVPPPAPPAAEHRRLSAGQPCPKKPKADIMLLSALGLIATCSLTVFWSYVVVSLHLAHITMQATREKSLLQNCHHRNIRAWWSENGVEASRHRYRTCLSPLITLCAAIIVHLPEHLFHHAAGLSFSGCSRCLSPYGFHTLYSTP